MSVKEANIGLDNILLPVLCQNVGTNAVLFCQMNKQEEMSVQFYLNKSILLRKNIFLKMSSAKCLNLNVSVNKISQDTLKQ